MASGTKKKHVLRNAGKKSQKIKAGFQMEIGNSRKGNSVKEEASTSARKKPLV